MIAEDATGPGEPGSDTDEGRAMLRRRPRPRAARAARLRHRRAGRTRPTRGTSKGSPRRSAPGGAGADVIVDDLELPDRTRSSRTARSPAAIKRVTEKGVIYFSAAANENLFNSAGEEISSWEAPKFRASTELQRRSSSPSTRSPKKAKAPTNRTCMDFDPGAGVDTEFGITVEPGRPLTVDLQWAEPWFGVEIRPSSASSSTAPGRAKKSSASGATANSARNRSLGFEWENEEPTPQEVRLVIARCAGACEPGGEQNARPAAEVPVPRGRLRRRRHRVSERQGRRHRRHRRPDHLRPRRLRRGEHRRRGQLGRIERRRRKRRSPTPRAAR